MDEIESRSQNTTGKIFIYVTAVAVSIYRFFGLSSNLDIEDRIAESLGFGFSVVILNFLVWLLTYVFHRKRWAVWHNDSVRAVIVITIFFVIGNIVDR